MGSFNIRHTIHKVKSEGFIAWAKQAEKELEELERKTEITDILEWALENHIKFVTVGKNKYPITLNDLNKLVEEYRKETDEE